MSARPVKLLVTGKMGSGKDFAADYLQQRYGARRWSRTELMKRLAHALAPEQIGDPEEVLQQIFPDGEERDEVRQELLRYMRGYLPEPGKPRILYQDVTEICQQHDPLCFEVELDRRIGSIGDVAFSLIDDVRSPQAFEYFSARGYKSLRIEAAEAVRRERMKQRDGYLPSESTFNHPSETGLDGVEHDFTIDNTSLSAEQLYEQLDAVVASLQAN